MRSANSAGVLKSEVRSGVASVLPGILTITTHSSKKTPDNLFLPLPLHRHITKA